MTWTDAKNKSDSILQGNNSSSEVEVDGHRVRKRSVRELVALDDMLTAKADEETNGSPNLKRAGFRVQAFNNGDGLI